MKTKQVLPNVGDRLSMHYCNILQNSLTHRRNTDMLQKDFYFNIIKAIMIVTANIHYKLCLRKPSNPEFGKKISC